MPLGTKVRLDPGHIVLDGDPASFQKGQTPSPSFFPKGAQPPPKNRLVCCGQTAGWIKMPLGTEVGLGPGHIVLDEDPALPEKGHSSLIFSPYLLWPNGRPSQLLLSTCT